MLMNERALLEGLSVQYASNYLIFWKGQSHKQEEISGNSLYLDLAGREHHLQTKVVLTQGSGPKRHHKLMAS